jgi:hypothetical protein
MPVAGVEPGIFVDLTSPLLPLPLLVLGRAGAGGVLLRSLWHAEIRQGLRILTSHGFPGALVVMLALWQLRALTPQGVALHVLGATMLQLMFGWRVALLGLALGLAAHTANGAGDWGSYGVNFVLMAVLPVLASAAVLWRVNRHLQGQPFAFILLAVFCCFSPRRFSTARSAPGFPCSTRTWCVAGACRDPAPSLRRTLKPCRARHDRHR